MAHLEQVRWSKGFFCPACGANTVSKKHEKNQQDRLQCWSCKRSHSATVGTIFHNSHIDLQRWFLLIALMLNAKKGLSSLQAARDLEMRQPTVWSMMHRIRAAMVDDGEIADRAGAGDSEPGLKRAREITTIWLRSGDERGNQRRAFRKMAKDMANRSPAKNA